MTLAFADVLAARFEEVRAALATCRPRDLVKTLAWGEGSSESSDTGWFMIFISCVTEPQFQELLRLIDAAAEREAQSKATEAEELIARLEANPALACELARAHGRWAKP